MAWWSYGFPVGFSGGSEMLVLSRKVNESIVINNDITVVVVEIKSNQVRLGIKAPREVPIHRREVQDVRNRAQTSKELPETD